MSRSKDPPSLGDSENEWKFQRAMGDIAIVQLPRRDEVATLLMAIAIDVR